MNAQKLVKMANEIAAFFEGEPERAAVLDGVANHLARFWDPRMRRELIDWIDQHGGQGARPSVIEAVTTHRARLTPAPRA